MQMPGECRLRGELTSTPDWPRPAEAHGPTPPATWPRLSSRHLGGAAPTPAMLQSSPGCGWPWPGLGPVVVSAGVRQDQGSGPAPPDRVSEASALSADKGDKPGGAGGALKCYRGTASTAGHNGITAAAGSRRCADGEGTLAGRASPGFAGLYDPRVIAVITGVSAHCAQCTRTVGEEGKASSTPPTRVARCGAR